MIFWTALVPMKAHSERVPNKNMRAFCDKPLFYYILGTLYSCKWIETVIINTDSNFIKDATIQDFPKTTVIDRPIKLRGDFVSINKIIEYDLMRAKGEYFIQTHSTNPLLSVSTLDKAINNFYERKKEYDSAFSVTKRQTRFYRKDASPLNHQLDNLLRTQDLPPIYEENSVFYLFSKQSFYNAGNRRIGNKPLMLEIPKIEAIDIDDQEDFMLAECLYEHRFQNNIGGL